MLVFVYVCSPYGGLRENVKRAHEYGQSVARDGYVPIIPHKMWHGIFDDNVPEQREKALAAGIELLKKCDQLRVFGKEITPGMAQEINYARAHGIPVVQGQAGTCNDMGELYKFFEQNFLFINRTVVDILNDYCEQGMTPQLIKEAIKQTAKKNAGVSYLETILNSWISHKIFTVDKLRSMQKPKTLQQGDYSSYDNELLKKLFESDE